MGLESVRDGGTPRAGPRLLPGAALDDFDRPRDRLWIDKATGVEYLTVGSDPLASLNPRATQVACFLVDEYGDIVYLRRRGDFGEFESKKIGTLSSGQVDRVDLADRVIH